MHAKLNASKFWIYVRFALHNRPQAFIRDNIHGDDPTDDFVDSSMRRLEATMTADEFRSLALSLPETSESENMNHPDFRVRGKIFATLGPDQEWGMVKVTPDDQAVFIRTEPEVFQPVKGAWGRRGCTYVRVEKAC